MFRYENIDFDIRVSHYHNDCIDYTKYALVSNITPLKINNICSFPLSSIKESQNSSKLVRYYIPGMLLFGKYIIQNKCYEHIFLY